MFEILCNQLSYNHGKRSYYSNYDWICHTISSNYAHCSISLVLFENVHLLVCLNFFFFSRGGQSCCPLSHWSPGIFKVPYIKFIYSTAGLVLPVPINTVQQKVIMQYILKGINYIVSFHVFYADRCASTSLDQAHMKCLALTSKY